MFELLYTLLMIVENKYYREFQKEEEEDEKHPENSLPKKKSVQDNFSK